MIVEYIFAAVIQTAACGANPYAPEVCPPEWIGSEATGTVSYDDLLTGLIPCAPAHVTFEFAPFRLDLDLHTNDCADGIRLSNGRFAVGGYLLDQGGAWGWDRDTGIFQADIDLGRKYVRGPVEIQRVPEPGSLALLALSLSTCLVAVRRREGK